MIEEKQLKYSWNPPLSPRPPPLKKKKKITGSLRFRHVDYFPSRLKILNSIPVKYWKAAYINKNENISRCTFTHTTVGRQLTFEGCHSKLGGHIFSKKKIRNNSILSLKLILKNVSQVCCLNRKYNCRFLLWRVAAELAYSFPLQYPQASTQFKWV